MVTESETIRELRRRMQVGEFATARPLVVEPWAMDARREPERPAWTDGDWRWVEMRTPVRTASREADVLVPAMQSAITGALAGVLAAIVAAVLAMRQGWPWYVVPAAWSLGTALASAAEWFHLLSETRALLVRVERYERADPPQAAPPLEALRVEVVEADRGGQHWSIDDLPVSREVLGRIVRRVDSGAASWSRRGIASTPGVGEDRARKILEDLERYGYLHYPSGRNHPGGAQPTAKGKALFGAL
jgi:hypothetical protein